MKIFLDAKYDALPISKFKLFSDLKDWSFPSAKSEYGKKLIALADIALGEDIPQLYASAYRRFNIDGNRSCYEADYFKRRIMLKQLLIGEIILNDNKYVDKIIDLVWLMLEETTWIIPAHNKNGRIVGAKHYSLGVDFEGKVQCVDLFSAETGAILSFVYFFLKEKLNSATDIICKRILYEIKRRTILPYIDYSDYWWMGIENSKKPNNWNPWVTSNVLTATALTESDTYVRNQVLEKAFVCLDNFIDGYDEDGGCNEGPEYWSHAVGALFMALELIYDITGGEANYFKEEIVYNMVDYIRKVNMRDCNYANFADCNMELFKKGMHSVIRMGQRTGDDILTGFAISNTKCDFLPTGYYLIYKDLKDICYDIPTNGEYIPNEFDVLENLQVATYRNKDGFTLTAKGGHNAESHNHNDIGQFILMNNEKPIVIDIGGPTYTKAVFSEHRYEVFPINGTWHSVPIFNGYAQKEGKEYACDFFSATKYKIAIEYHSAYEKEAGVKKCLREIILGKDNIEIEETIDFDGEDAIFNYYLLDEPKKERNGFFVFKDGTRIIAPEESEIVPIPIPDEKVKKSWGTDYFYKLTIKITQPGECKFGIKFERCT